MGPIERQLRARLNFGDGITDADVWKIGGSIAVSVLKRLVREGVAVVRDGRRYTLATHTPDPAAMERAERDRLARLESRRKEIEAREARRQFILAQEERQRAEAAVKADREREARMLSAGLRAYAPDEQRLVIQERAAALRDSRRATA